MSIRLVVKSPATMTHYLDLIKRIFFEFNYEKAFYLSSLIKIFCDNYNETKSFKIKIFIEKSKCLSFSVKDTWDELISTKYLINESKVQRYDQRNNFWYATLEISEYNLKIAKAIIVYDLYKEELAKPLPSITDEMSEKAAKALENEKGNYHSIRSMSLCGRFNNNYIKLFSGCCSELYCCSQCHDEENQHKWVRAEYFVCLMCMSNTYQRYLGGKFTCSICKYNHSVKPVGY